MTRLPSLDTGDFGLPPLPSIGPRTRKKPQLEFDPDTQDTLARKAGRIAVGGISAAANLLDLPGSMVRDVIAGQNPVDQLLHPFSGESRTSGRDLARKFGLAGKQDNWKNFLGGLAIDVGTDPLTYVFPLGAMTKAGKIAKAANIGDEAMITAARKFGRPVGEIGKREAGLRTTLGDVFHEADFAGKRAAVNAARAEGVNLRDVMDDPLRGMFATGVLGKVKNVTGFGPTSQAIARKLDTLGSTIRYARVPGTEIEPLNAVARLFSAPLGDTKTRTIQPFARRMFNLKTGGRAAAMREMSGYVDELVKSGHATSAQADELRGWLEGTRGGQMAPELAPLVGKLQDRQVQILQDAKAWGTNPKEWTSPYALYWPRHATDRPGKAGSAAFSSFGANTPNAKQRLRELAPFTDEQGVTHAIRGETSTIKEILQDPDIAAAVTNRNSRKNIAALIEFKYGHLVPKKYLAKGGSEGNRYLALAKWMERMDPELKQAGMFGNHPLLDMQAELIGHNDAIGSAQTIRDMLVSPGMLKSASADVRETVQVGRLLKILKIKAGDATEGFGRKLAEGLGIDLTAMAPDDANKLLKDLMGMRIDRPIAHDVLKFKKAFTSPEPVNEIVGLVDSFTNLWKGLQTGVWPAFHVRNFVSGQYQNWVGNMFSRESVKDTWKLLRGEEIPGAANMPIVKQMAARQGIANLTDKQATNILGQLVYSHGLSHRFAGEHVNIQGALNTLNPATIEGAIQEIPGFGVNHIQPGRVARKAVAREAGTSLNPLASRGFMGQMESKFGPAAAGEELGGVIEAMNRIAPFLHQLKRGVDPVSAAQKVGAAQVMYQSRYYTKSEQQVLARMFPFYKFCVPVSHEILTRDGWKHKDGLRIGEEVLTYDCDTRELKWEPLLAVHVFPHDGPINEYCQSRKHKKIRFQFTDGHRWPVVTPARVVQGYNIKEARRIRTGDSIRKDDCFIRTGDFRGEESILSPRHAALLGWLVTDGYMRKRPGIRGKREYWDGVIYQSPKKHLEELISLTGSQPRNPHPETGVVGLNVKASDLQVITEHFRSKSDLPGVVCRLSREAAEAMRDAMFKAEGYTSSSGREMFYQYCDTGVKEAFQILCQLTGRSANYGQQGCTIARPNLYYNVGTRISRTYYEGDVWCPETPSGTWVMRHNGDVVITGNSSRMMPWTLRQLAEQPTGKLGTTLRVANRLRNPSVQTPDYVSETTAIPMGEAPDGSQRYLTGAGLMFEDPLSFFGGGARGGLLEAGSRLNPFLKGPLEWMTNQTFFQKGPMGGRSLEDLDPTIGRTLANLTGRQKPVTWPGSQGMEFAIANSPLSRATSTARAMTYPIRALTDPMMAGQFGPELGRTAMNLLTGARVTSVSPASQEAMLRERGRQLMKGMGGKEFLRSYIPADAEAEMTPDQLKEAQALENLMNTLAARSKSRADARKKAQEKK